MKNAYAAQIKALRETFFQLGCDSGIQLFGLILTVSMYNHMSGAFKSQAKFKEFYEAVEKDAHEEYVKMRKVRQLKSEGQRAEQEIADNFLQLFTMCQEIRKRLGMEPLQEEDYDGWWCKENGGKNGTL